MFLKRCLWLLVLIPTLFLLSACACNRCENTTKYDCNVNVQDIIRQVHASSYDQCRSCMHQFCVEHVQYIQVGDQIKLVLAADQFFVENTQQLDGKYYPVLDKIAAFLCCLQKANIKVEGYTDDCGSCAYNLALSREQAQAIANYLEERYIDARVLYAVGYGPNNPIASNTTECGRAMNRRVEITLRKITDYYDH